MRQKLFIFIALIFLAVLLVGLNAASYVEKPEVPDSEFYPNRSTYNGGATGTRALFELLAETGRRPARWQEAPAALLLTSDKNKPSTFVVVGATRREFADKEIEQLLEWVSRGGRLVVIDRAPPQDLIATTANWKISIQNNSSPDNNAVLTDPSNQLQMTAKTDAAKPIQPTLFTEKINAVQPSRLASGILFERLSGENAPPKSGIYKGISSGLPPPPPPPPPPAVAPPKAANSNQKSGTSSGSNVLATIGNKVAEANAPVAHLAGNGRNLLVDFPFGAGQIVLLSDPYIVSNAGIDLVDNAQLAVNVLASRGGIIAFDEYHQGFGANKNRLIEYFSGTPLVAIFTQAAILLALIFFAQSRRFARPLPESEPNRLSKLEYVSAMAQLQQRTKAYDLAIENIYADFRRRAARSLGADNYSVTLSDLARMIGERTNENAGEIERLLHQCEEIVRGERTNKKEVLKITSRLREIEGKLGLQRRKRTAADI